MLYALCHLTSHIPHLQFRNPKLGTRPKGGSPKDKSKIRNHLPAVLCRLSSLPRLAFLAFSLCSMPYALCLQQFSGRLLFH
jgi:hypothetical protein